MTRHFTLDDVDVAGKRVLLRVDFNVPVENGKVTDATRIEHALPTIRELIAKKSRVIIVAHFDRPKGKRVPEMSLKQIHGAVETVLGLKVGWCDDCIGPEAEAAVAAMAPGSVLLLENVRYHKGEEANDPAFAASLARLGDVYVNDGFSIAHRAHASVEAITKLMPHAAGRGMQAELEALARVLLTPQRPVAAIVGGAKVSTKLDLLENLAARVNMIIIGGGMANTFIGARGFETGKSLVERDLYAKAREIEEKAKKLGCELVLPEDGLVAHEFKSGARAHVFSTTQLPAEGMMLDIGPASIEAVKTKLGQVRTIVWNGPMGAFELDGFDKGTMAIAHEVSRLTRAGKLVSVAGGGDTLAAVNKAGVADTLTYVSTAGGAFLEWLEGKELPGVKALEKH